MLLVPPLAATPRLPRWFALLSAAAATASLRIGRLVDGLRRRHETAMLARVDDHLLADLGLSRGDVSDAFSGPPWEDPTVLLRARALERRLSRHRAAHGFPPAGTASAKPRGAFRPPRLTP